jgi:hypothetical protein
VPFQSKSTYSAVAGNVTFRRSDHANRQCRGEVSTLGGTYSSDSDLCLQILASKDTIIWQTSANVSINQPWLLIRHAASRRTEGSPPPWRHRLHETGRMWHAIFCFFATVPSFFIRPLPLSRFGLYFQRPSQPQLSWITRNGVVPSSVTSHSNSEVSV